MEQVVQNFAHSMISIDFHMPLNFGLGDMTGTPFEVCLCSSLIPFVTFVWLEVSFWGDFFVANPFCLEINPNMWKNILGESLSKSLA